MSKLRLLAFWITVVSPFAASADGIGPGRLTRLTPEQLETQYLAADGECRSWGLTNGHNNPHGLSVAEATAIYGYTYADFNEINAGLYKKVGRRGIMAKLSKCNKIQIDIMDRALAKLPTYSGVVFRGDAIQNYPEGRSEFTLYGFASTSKSRKRAESFVRDALLIVKGVSNGKPLNPYGYDYSERTEDEEEVLLPRGTRIKVNGRHQEKIQVITEHDQREVEAWVLEAEIVD